MIEDMFQKTDSDCPPTLLLRNSDETAPCCPGTGPESRLILASAARSRVTTPVAMLLLETLMTSHAVNVPYKSNPLFMQSFTGTLWALS